MKYKYEVIKYFETIEEVIKTADSCSKQKDFCGYIAIVSVESLEKDYPYAIQMCVDVDDYKDFFFYCTLTIMEDGGLFNEYGDAGEDELDPLKTVDECIEFCIDKLEVFIDSIREDEEDFEPEW